MADDQDPTASREARVTILRRMVVCSASEWLQLRMSVVACVCVCVGANCVCAFTNPAEAAPLFLPSPNRQQAEQSHLHPLLTILNNYPFFIQNIFMYIREEHGHRKLIGSFSFIYFFSFFFLIQTLKSPIQSDWSFLSVLLGPPGGSKPNGSVRLVCSL